MVTFVLDLLKQGDVKDAQMKLLLQQSFGFGEQERIKLMTLLNQSDFIQIKSLGDTDVVYSLKGSKTKKVKQDMNPLEQQVLKALEEKKGEGMNKAELKKTLGLNPNVITKILKKLQQQGQVNQFKTKKNQMVFVSNEFVPEEKLVGGNLFAKGDIDCEFVGKIEQKIVEAVKDSEEFSYTQLLGIISGGEGKFLNEKEINSVLNVMVLDGKLRKEGQKYTMGGRGNFLLSENRVPCE